MSWKIVLSLIFFIIVVSLLIVYWFIPLSTVEFKISSGNSSFNYSDLNKESTQFYPNMRFPESAISYRVENCPLSKQNDMERAFEAVSSLTVLDFYPVSSGEEIYVTCDSKVKLEGRFFIAGEGGPVNITKAGDFNVIFNGKILLLRDSNCPNPNIGVHELLHVLGFDHVQDPNDIMFNVSRCDQQINPYMVEFINEIYSIPSYPDLVLEDASAVMHGKYLNVNMSVRNNGLKSSSKAQLFIYADDKLVKELDLDGLEIGHGRVISLTNVWVAKIKIDKLRFVVDYKLDELKVDNNEIVLQIRK